MRGDLAGRESGGAPPARRSAFPAARASRGIRGRVALAGRLVEILTVLSASGFDDLLGALGLRTCISPRCVLHRRIGFEPCPHHVGLALPRPERLAVVLERLGPTFVKLGQMAALRPDYVPEPYTEALSRLHDRAEPFPAAQARAVVEDELGAPIERLFAEFSTEPFAAASLSQVHRAVTLDGRAVAVKVQRPGIAEQMTRDLTLLALLARRLERRRPEALAFRPTQAVAEFAEYTRRELDFRKEARTSERVRDLFASHPSVLVPAVDWERTTARVLTTDLVDGRAPAAAGELRGAGLDPDAVLRVGAEAVFRQIFEFGLFHADPHPGNLLLVPGERGAFLDVGLFGRLSMRQRRAMAVVLQGMITADHAAAADQLLRLASRRPKADPDGFRDAAADLVEEWLAAEGRAGSIASLLLRQLALGARSGIVFPRDLLLLARALLVLEGTARVIVPDVGLAELARPLMPELERLLLLDTAGAEELWGRLRASGPDLVLELCELLPELVARARSGPAATARPRGIATPLLAAGALVALVSTIRRAPGGRRR